MKKQTEKGMDTMITKMGEEKFVRHTYKVDFISLSILFITEIEDSGSEEESVVIDGYTFHTTADSKRVPEDLRNKLLSDEVIRILIEKLGTYPVEKHYEGVLHKFDMPDFYQIEDVFPHEYFHHAAILKNIFLDNFNWLEDLGLEISASEADKKWRLPEGSIRQSCNRGRLRKYKEIGMIRKSGKVWLVSEKAMREVYGEPKKN